MFQQDNRLDMPYQGTYTTSPISTLTVERTGGASHRSMLRSPAINALSPYDWSVDRTMAGTAR